MPHINKQFHLRIGLNPILVSKLLGYSIFGPYTFKFSVWYLLFTLCLFHLVHTLLKVYFIPELKITILVQVVTSRQLFKWITNLCLCLLKF